MMKTVRVGLLLDESGSMGGLRNDVVKAFNAEMHKLRKLMIREVEARVTVATFFSLFSVSRSSVVIPSEVVYFGDSPCLESADIAVRFLCKDVPFKEVPRLTDENYAPHGYTPLRDAVGCMVDTLSGFVNGSDDVVLIIFTDGLENASKEFTHDQVIKLLQDKQSMGWRVTYIGSLGIEDQAREFGIHFIHSFDLGTSQGIKCGLRCAGTGIECYMRSLLH